MTDPAPLDTPESAHAARLRREASSLRSQAERLLKLAAEIDGDDPRPAADVEADVVRRLTLAGEIE